LTVAASPVVGAFCTPRRSDGVGEGVDCMNILTALSKADFSKPLETQQLSTDAESMMFGAIKSKKRFASSSFQPSCFSHCPKYSIININPENFLNKLIYVAAIIYTDQPKICRLHHYNL
jgi:hypothetical protein